MGNNEPIFFSGLTVKILEPPEEDGQPNKSFLQLDVYGMGQAASLGSVMCNGGIK